MTPPFRHRHPNWYTLAWFVGSLATILLLVWVL